MPSACAAPALERKNAANNGTAAPNSWAQRPGATARLWPSEQLIRLICRALPAERRTGTALDVGCGNGRNTIALASLGFNPVLATDPCEELIEALTQRVESQGWPVTATAAALPHLPHADGTADMAISWGVLYVLESREQTLAALREMRRVLKPGGHVIADWRTHMDSLRQFAGERVDAVTCVMNAAAPLNLAGSHYSFWTRDELEAIYQDAGLRISDAQREELYEMKTDQCYSWWQVCAQRP